MSCRINLRCSPCKVQLAVQLSHVATNELLWEEQKQKKTSQAHMEEASFPCGLGMRLTWKILQPFHTYLATSAVPLCQSSSAVNRDCAKQQQQPPVEREFQSAS